MFKVNNVKIVHIFNEMKTHKQTGFGDIASFKFCNIVLIVFSYHEADKYNHDIIYSKCFIE